MQLYVAIYVPYIATPILLLVKLNSYSYIANYSIDGLRLVNSINEN